MRNKGSAAEHFILLKWKRGHRGHKGHKRRQGTQGTHGTHGTQGTQTKKKFMQGKMPKKKFIQKEGPIVTFSESLSFRNQQYYQAQYEKTKITFFLLKGDN